MKEQPLTKPLQQPPKLTKTRSGSHTTNQNRVHQRGDKVVVNGAKQSLMAILRRYMCDCGRHCLQKATSKFLTLNKVSASYDLVVWMIIYLRMNCQDDVYDDILREYIGKMNKKVDQDQTHHSPKYINSKKATLKKFILSAESLSTTTNNKITSHTIQTSVSLLYTKGKSKVDALKKIISYLKKFNKFFKQNDLLIYEEQRHSHLQCSFSNNNNKRSVLSLRSNEQIQPQRLTLVQQANTNYCNIIMASQQHEVDTNKTIQPSYQINNTLTEKPAKEEQPKDQPNKSYRQNQDNQSFDLFDQLILSHQDQSVDSPNSNIFFYFN